MVMLVGYPRVLCNMAVYITHCCHTNNVSETTLRWANRLQITRVPCHDHAIEPTQFHSHARRSDAQSSVATRGCASLRRIDTLKS